MSIELPKDKEAQIIESIKQYVKENFENEIGNLKASLLLNYFITEIGPVIYNQAIIDAQTFITDKINDLDSACYHPEFMYWKN